MGRQEARAAACVARCACLGAESRRCGADDKGFSRGSDVGAWPQKAEVCLHPGGDHGLGVAPVGDAVCVATRSLSPASASAASVHRRARPAAAHRGGAGRGGHGPLCRHRRSSAHRGASPLGPRHSDGLGVGDEAIGGFGAAMAAGPRPGLLGVGARVALGGASAQLRLEPGGAGAAVCEKRQLGVTAPGAGARASALNPGVDPPR